MNSEALKVAADLNKKLGAGTVVLASDVFGTGPESLLAPWHWT